jgi:AcrR family transcriptional regulator
VNQKRRTRAAIVDAARRMLADGTTPTVAEAAARSEVSRTTAYRYFPSQDALLVELAMNANVDDIEELVGAGSTAETAIERTLAVLELLHRHMADAEVEYRTALRLYLDQWLREKAAGDDAPIVREGRRRRWFEQTLAPLRGSVSDEEWRQVVTGLCMLGGAESLVVLRDVCALDAEHASAAVRWAAATLLDATFR